MTTKKAMLNSFGNGVATTLCAVSLTVALNKGDLVYTAIFGCMLTVSVLMVLIVCATPAEDVERIVRKE